MLGESQEVAIFCQRAGKFPTEKIRVLTISFLLLFFQNVGFSVPSFALLSINFLPQIGLYDRPKLA